MHGFLVHAGADNSHLLQQPEICTHKGTPRTHNQKKPSDGTEGEKVMVRKSASIRDGKSIAQKMRHDVSLVILCESSGHVGYC